MAKKSRPSENKIVFYTPDGSDDPIQQFRHNLEKRVRQLATSHDWDAGTLLGAIRLAYDLASPEDMGVMRRNDKSIWVMVWDEFVENTITFPAITIGTFQGQRMPKFQHLWANRINNDEQSNQDESPKPVTDDLSRARERRAARKISPAVAAAQIKSSRPSAS